MPFRNALAVRDTDGRGRTWALTEDLLYHGSVEQFTVPAGFVTDFASIPRFFWRILPPWSEHMRAAVLHDWFYSVAYATYSRGRGHEPVIRRDADGLFRRAMRESGVGGCRRWVMWLAVRVFGRSRFRR